MPKHIISGLKYLTAVELRKKNFTQKEIAEKLEMDRSTVSHYLNGRNISWHSIEIADVIRNFCPRDFSSLAYALLQDKQKTRIIVITCSNRSYDCVVKNTCIGCGVCVDACVTDAIVLDELEAQINSDWCCGCRICMEICPTRSIEIKEVENDGDYRNY